MAIELSNIAVDITRSLVTEINNLVAGLVSLEDLNDFAVDAGITTFATYETEIQAEYAHLDGAKVNQVLGVILPELNTWLNAQTVTGGDYAGATYAAMLNKVRTT